MTLSISEADKPDSQHSTDHVTGPQPFSSQSAEMHMFVNSYHEGIVFLTPLHNESRKVIDFVYSYINNTAEEMLQRAKKDMIGRTLMELFPGTLAEGIFNVYIEVLLTGKTSTLQFHYSREGFNTWFRQRVEKFENGILVHTVDIGQTNEPLSAKVINEG